MGYDVSLLIEKIERIERENARIRRSARFTKTSIVCAIAAYAAFSTVPRVLSITSPPVLTATGFNLVDTSNRLRASLAPTADGNMLTFYDSTGKRERRTRCRMTSFRRWCDFVGEPVLLHFTVFYLPPFIDIGRTKEGMQIQLHYGEPFPRQG